MSALIPTVCPKAFDAFFEPFFGVFMDIQTDERIPAEIRDASIKQIGATLALELIPKDPERAAAMFCRFRALMVAVENGTLTDIGQRFFGDPGHLVRRWAPNLFKIRGVAILAAAVADLLPGTEGFTVDCLSAAVLAAPAGCPEDLVDCPPDPEVCDATVHVFVVKISI